MFKRSISSDESGFDFIALVDDFNGTEKSTADAATFVERASSAKIGDTVKRCSGFAATLHQELEAAIARHEEEEVLLHEARQKEAALKSPQKRRRRLQRRRRQR